MKFFWVIPVTVIVGYLGLCVFLYFMQTRAIFFPDLPGRQLEATPKDINLQYEDVTTKTSDGESIHGWFVPNEDAKLTLLLCHGNAGNISHRLESIALFNSLGLNVLIFDYRGYGRSTGKISEPGFYQDVDAMWQVLTKTKGIAAENIIVFGRSLGAAIASHLSTKVRPGGVILESAFTSALANVEINLKSLEDKSLTRSVRTELTKKARLMKKIRLDTEVKVGKIIRG